MTTQEKLDKILAYYLLHRSEGLSADEAIEHIANGLGVSTEAIRAALSTHLASSD